MISIMSAGSQRSSRAIAENTNSNGRFATRVRLQRSSVIVAHAFGTAYRQSAGSRPIRVTISAPPDSVPRHRDP